MQNNTIIENRGKMKLANIHTFAIMAYKSASFLESQNVKSELYITTSTPSKHIASLADMDYLYISTMEKKVLKVIGNLLWRVQKQNI